MGTFVVNGNPWCRAPGPLQPPILVWKKSLTLTLRSTCYDMPGGWMDVFCDYDGGCSMVVV